MNLTESLLMIEKRIEELEQELKELLFLESKHKNNDILKATLSREILLKRELIEEYQRIKKEGPYINDKLLCVVKKYEI